jgi:hypothetical protein
LYEKGRCHVFRVWGRLPAAGAGDIAANKGEYRCPACDEVVETFDGSAFIAYRMTIQPSLKAGRP